MCVHILNCFSHVQLSAILWTVSHQALLSTGFSRNTGVDCHALLQATSQPREQTCISMSHELASQVALMVRNLPANAGDERDTGSISGLGRSPGGGHGNPLQYSCLENPQGQRSLAGYSPWGCRVRQDWNNLTHTHLEEHILSRPSHMIIQRKQLLIKIVLACDQTPHEWVPLLSMHS